MRGCEHRASAGTWLQAAVPRARYWMSYLRPMNLSTLELTQVSFKMLDSSSELLTDTLRGGMGFTGE